MLKQYVDCPNSKDKLTGSQLLQRTYPGQLPSVAKDIHNVIVPVDFTEAKDVLPVVETLQGFVKRGVPIRFGFVPLLSSPAAISQARVVYYLLDTFGLGAMMDYLQGVSLILQHR
jgi:UDP-glucose:glycoprotein glucosyltransferase